MYTNKELKEIYEKRYSNAGSEKGAREINLYQKYRELLLPQKGKIQNKVLDLGCGIGYKTVGFTKDDEIVLAIDLSENAIKYCKQYHKRNLLEFKAMDAFVVEGKFNLITAFGFSLFNTSDTNRFVSTVEHFFTTNFLKVKGSTILIGSFTDFSGGGKDTWYLHTKEELSNIKKELEIMFPVKIDIVFPHKNLKNYFGSGIYNFVAESMKLILKRKRTFFIRIEHE